MKVMQKFLDLHWTWTGNLIISEAQQHIDLKNKESRTYSRLTAGYYCLSGHNEGLRTCSRGGERNSLVLRAVRAADILSACMTSL